MGKKKKKRLRVVVYVCKNVRLIRKKKKHETMSMSTLSNSNLLFYASQNWLDNFELILDYWYFLETGGSLSKVKNWYFAML